MTTSRPDSDPCAICNAPWRQCVCGKPIASRASNQQVPFRLLIMPCCHTHICWVNPRRPNYCPECGKRVILQYPKARWEATYSDAWLRIEDDDKAYLLPDGVTI